MDENLPARVKYWLNEAKHDCFFLVGAEDGETEKIGANKILLMGDSEPFRAMLGDGELAETGDIELKDMEPETFKCFLKCIYGASNVVIPKLTFEESAKLLYVVEKYLVDVVKSELIDHLEKLFSFDNIFVALSHPVCYQTVRLKNKIMEILKYDFDKVTNDDKFLELSYSAISWVLQQKILVYEIKVWNAVLRWAKHKSGSSDGEVLRSCVHGLLKYIRFLTMDYNDFREGVESTKILLEEEINDICRAFVLGKPCSFDHLCKNRNNRLNIYTVSKNIHTSIHEFPKTASIRCSISSVQNLTSYNSYSKTYHWAGQLWYLTVGKRINNELHYLGVYVGCSGITQNWNCTADVEIVLVNRTGKSDITRKYTQTFCPSLTCWGFVSFYEWNALLNPDNGFVKDDKVILRVDIQTKNG